MPLHETISCNEQSMAMRLIKLTVRKLFPDGMMTLNVWFKVCVFQPRNESILRPVFLINLFVVLVMMIDVGEDKTPSEKYA